MFTNKKKTVSLLTGLTVVISSVAVPARAWEKDGINYQDTYIASYDFGKTWSEYRGPFWDKNIKQGQVQADTPRLPGKKAPKGGEVTRLVTAFENQFQGVWEDKVRVRWSTKPASEAVNHRSWGCPSDPMTTTDGRTHYIDGDAVNDAIVNKAACEAEANRILAIAKTKVWSEDTEAIGKLLYNDGTPIDESDKVLADLRSKQRQNLQRGETSEEWLKKANELAKYDPETVEIRDKRVSEIVNQWRGKPWSADMELALSDLAKHDKRIAEVLGPAQKDFLSTEATNARWTPELDDAMTSIRVVAGYGKQTDVAAALDKARARFVQEFLYRTWSPNLEEALGGLVQRGYKPAIEMLKKKRTEEIGRVSGENWSPERDAVLREVARFDSDVADQLNKERMAFLADKEKAPWSKELDDEVSELASVWVPASDFMESKRASVVDQWSTRDWSKDLDKALAPLADVYQPAADLLQEKRDIFVTVAASKEFSEVENDLNYLAEEKGFTPAAELAATKRAEKGDATDADPSDPSKPGKTEDTKPVDFKKVSEMTIEDARDLGPAERRHIVSEALKNDVPLTDFDSIARVYIGDVENHPLNAEAMENARKLADLGVPGAQKAYTIQAVSIAATVLASVAALVGVVNNYLPQIKQALAAAGIRV